MLIIPGENDCPARASCSSWETLSIICQAVPLTVLHQCDAFSPAVPVQTHPRQWRSQFVRDVSGKQLSLSSVLVRRLTRSFNAETTLRFRGWRCEWQWALSCRRCGFQLFLQLRQRAGDAAYRLIQINSVRLTIKTPGTIRLATARGSHA